MFVFRGKQKNIAALLCLLLARGMFGTCDIMKLQSTAKCLSPSSKLKGKAGWLQPASSRAPQHPDRPSSLLPHPPAGISPTQPGPHGLPRQLLPHAGSHLSAAASMAIDMSLPSRHPQLKNNFSRERALSRSTAQLWEHTECTPGAGHPTLPPVLLRTPAPTSRTGRWTWLPGGANKDALENTGSTPAWWERPARDPQHLRGEGEPRRRAGWHGPSTPGLPGPAGALTQRPGPRPPRLPAARETRLFHPPCCVLLF